MFTLKFPLVEAIVKSAMEMHAGMHLWDHENMSPNDIRQEATRREFELRLALWQKPLQWLKSQLEYQKMERAAIGVAATAGF